MRSVDFVYPNLSPVNLKSKTPRGGLLERWKLAKETGCKYIEVPGHLIYNKTEERLTNLEIGDFLGEYEIQLLYTRYDVPPKLEYILHTEPSIGKTNRYNRRIYSPINWYDREWRQKYCKMIIDIVDYLNHTPSVIEIHPGYKQNSFNDLAKFQHELLDHFKERHDSLPLIFLENRTEQFISTGTDIREYWTHIKDHYPELIQQTGIVLDVQQLYTKTGSRFLHELDQIPRDGMKGFHIHTKHRWPKLNDPIPWKTVFGILRDLDHDLIINPEIHQKNRVSQTIEFCKQLLK